MNEFGLEEQDLRTYSPLTLAYIGDAIFELVVRTVLVERKNTQPEKLHKAATKIVKAETQALMIEALKEDLTDEELTVYKRGRNAKAVTRAKNATMSEYRRATGFEALMGYLYLKGDMFFLNRICLLIQKKNLFSDHLLEFLINRVISL